MLCFDYANPSTHIAATMNHERVIHTHALSNTLSLSHSHTHTHTHTLSNSLSLSLSLSLSFSLSLSHTHTPERELLELALFGVLLQHVLQQRVHPCRTAPLRVSSFSEPHLFASAPCHASACSQNCNVLRVHPYRTAPLRVSTFPYVSILEKIHRSACPPLPNHTRQHHHVSTTRLV